MMGCRNPQGCLEMQRCMDQVFKMSGEGGSGVGHRTWREILGRPEGHVAGMQMTSSRVPLWVGGGWQMQGGSGLVLSARPCISKDGSVDKL